MRYFFVLLIALCIQTVHGQDVKSSFSDALHSSAFSYPLLKNNSENSFPFYFASLPLQTNYFVVKPVPSFNSLPSLFCKLEYKLEIKSKLAPRFRLGSLQYANWMEGKGEYYNRYY